MWPILLFEVNYRLTGNRNWLVHDPDLILIEFDRKKFTIPSDTTMIQVRNIPPNTTHIWGKSTNGNSRKCFGSTCICYIQFCTMWAFKIFYQTFSTFPSDKTETWNIYNERKNKRQNDIFFHLRFFCVATPREWFVHSRIKSQ